jgi:hypothetical protein
MLSRSRVNAKRRRGGAVEVVHVVSTKPNLPPPGIGHNQPPVETPPPPPPLSHEDLNRFYSLKKAAEMLGCHEATVRRNFGGQIERIGKRRVGLRFRYIIAARPIAAA